MPQLGDHEVKLLLSIAAVVLLLAVTSAGQNANAASSEMKNTTKSDREQAGLRGPVKTCEEEMVYPAAKLADGKEIPQRKSTYVTEYDANGRHTATRSRNSDGSEWVTRNTYDSAGHLLKIATSNAGAPAWETNYVYDDQGRLQSETDSRKPPVTFRYDEQGRKTRVAVSRAADYRPNVAVSAESAFDVAANFPPNLPGGGTATTICDEHDRAIEVQVRDAQGEVVSRMVRNYDAEGRISDEKDVLQRPERMFPAELRAKMAEQAGVSQEEADKEMRARLTELMGGHTGMSGNSYTYDAQGRKTKTRRRIFNGEQEIETIYNEQGDVAGEITRARAVQGAEPDPPGFGMPEYSETHYSYVYDSFGNWTEQTITYRSSPEGSFQPSSTRRRTLTYY